MEREKLGEGLDKMLKKQGGHHFYTIACKICIHPLSMYMTPSQSFLKRDGTETFIWKKQALGLIDNNLKIVFTTNWVKFSKACF